MQDIKSTMFDEAIAAGSIYGRMLVTELFMEATGQDGYVSLSENNKKLLANIERMIQLAKKEKYAEIHEDVE